tara:strand:- start:5502 stop:6203 length:702 start_codon:yes stop_codon:yes gene_type:complete
MQRFYQNAKLGLIEDINNFGIFLDTKPLKTPQKKLFTIPCLKLAEMICEEWNSQDEIIIPSTMPLTRIGYTALDQIEPNRSLYEQQISRYLITDTLCYRVAHPIELAKIQDNTWSPLLTWVEKEFGIYLKETYGVVAIDQPMRSIKKVNDILMGLGIWELSGLLLSVRVSGSLVVGLGMYKNYLDADEAFKVSEVERTWQIKRWGEDSEIQEIRRKIKGDFLAAENFFEAISI